MLPAGAELVGLSWPWLASAIGAGLLTIALHLIDPRRAPRVIFPGALVLRAHARGDAGARARTLRRWPLILYRALLVVLAILAFDRLALRTPTSTVAGERAVIVLDVSASMATPSAPVTRFDRALERVRTIANELDPARTPLALVLAGETPIDATPVFVRNGAAFSDALDGARVLNQTDRLDRAVAHARALLAPDPGVVHLVTDGQHAVGAAPGLVVHRVETEPAPTNDAVLALEWSPRHPVEGERVTLSARVRAERDGVLTFWFGDRMRGVPFEGGADEVVLSATFRAEMPADLEVRASIPDDEFGYDDERAGMLRVRDGIDVRTLGDTSVFAGALAPRGVASPFVTKPIRSADEVLGADVLLCAPSKPLSVPMSDAILAAHRAGVALLWLVTKESSARAFEAFASASGHAWHVTPTGDRSGGWSVAGGTLPALSESGLLDEIDVRAPFWIDASDAEAMLVDADGRMQGARRGAFGVLAIDPDALAGTPAMVLLAHEAVRLLHEARPVLEQPEALPERESDPVFRGSEERASEIVTSAIEDRATHDRSIASWIALVALGMLCVEPLLRRGEAR